MSINGPPGEPYKRSPSNGFAPFLHDTLRYGPPNLGKMILFNNKKTLIRGRTRSLGNEACAHFDCKSKPSLLLVAMHLLLVVRPGAPSIVLAPSSDALCS